MTNTDTLYTSPLMELQPEWIDYNGHLNMAYYNVLFDRGCDGFFERMGLGPDYIKTRNLSFYTAEAHVRYVREIHLGDKVKVSMRIVDFDQKRVHCIAELMHEDGWLSATSETMSLHIDMNVTKVTPFPNDIMQEIEKQAAMDKALPANENVGRQIGIVRKGIVRK